MAGYKIITPPAQEPVSVADARAFLQLGSDTSHDTLIALLIQSAREGIERELNRALITQTIEDEYSVIPSSGTFTLRFSPVTEILSFRVFDTLETECHIDRYWKDIISEPASISFLEKSDIPSNVRAVKIKYKAGYASDIAVPARIREAILINVRHSFDCRMNCKEDPGISVSDKLLWTYRVWHPDTNVI